MSVQFTVGPIPENFAKISGRGRGRSESELTKSLRNIPVNQTATATFDTDEDFNREVSKIRQSASSLKKKGVVDLIVRTNSATRTVMISNPDHNRVRDLATA